MAQQNNSQNICQTCWSITNDFHTFYISIKKAQENWNQTTGNCVANNKELDLTTIKYEWDRDSDKLSVNENDDNKNILKNGNTIKTTKLIKKITDKQISEFFHMECDLCQINFDTFVDAQRHYRNEHNQAGYIKCCGRKFLDRRRILAHIQRHINPMNVYK